MSNIDIKKLKYTEEDARILYDNYIKQYELNKTWLLDLIINAHNRSKPLVQILQEANIHIENMKNLENRITSYEIMHS